jgi:hypothetical protein
MSHFESCQYSAITSLNRWCKNCLYYFISSDISLLDHSFYMASVSGWLYRIYIYILYGCTESVGEFVTINQRRSSYTYIWILFQLEDKFRRIN